MPLIKDPKLTLTKVGVSNVRIDVTYTLIFSPLESFFAALGVSYSELAQLRGVDRGSTTFLFAVGAGPVPVEPIVASQKLDRLISRTVPRADLDEDRDLLQIDEDEIIGEIRILAFNFPKERTEVNTNLVVLSDVGGTFPSKASASTKRRRASGSARSKK